MEVEIRLAPLLFTRVMIGVFGRVLTANLNKVEQGSLFSALFGEKGSILKHLQNIFAKKWINAVNQTFLYFKIKPTMLFLTILTYLNKNDKIKKKLLENVQINLNIYKISNIDKSF